MEWAYQHPEPSLFPLMSNLDKYMNALCLQDPSALQAQSRSSPEAARVPGSPMSPQRALVQGRQSHSPANVVSASGHGFNSPTKQAIQPYMELSESLYGKKSTWVADHSRILLVGYVPFTLGVGKITAILQGFGEMAFVCDHLSQSPTSGYQNLVVAYYDRHNAQMAFEELQQSDSSPAALKLCYLSSRTAKAFVDSRGELDIVRTLTRTLARVGFHDSRWATNLLLQLKELLEKHHTARTHITICTMEESQWFAQYDQLPLDVTLAKYSGLPIGSLNLAIEQTVTKTLMVPQATPAPIATPRPLAYSLASLDTPPGSNPKFRSLGNDSSHLYTNSRSEAEMIYPPRGRGDSHSSFRALYALGNARNVVRYERIMSGEDNRTTFMIRNIPNKYTQKMLIDLLNESHFGQYDFVYLRMDFTNHCNCGYAFVNFMDPRSIITLAQRLVGKRWDKFNSDKVCSIRYADYQGKDQLVEHFRNSNVMLMDPSYRPKIFYSSGPLKGHEEAFPDPTIQLSLGKFKHGRIFG
ncbi:hypothetical protein H4R34_001483 [Dimargaris verticillata]|uniref:RRM domain-containing protein n=1 Tax=Dimargaris verticillata TaxID=2761393 RepID=A0A9W8EEG5_9FUNG|nr:hypothetical protein H4R34_001483 [Dimargaris verticillata]